ncbi:hypothetical protein CVT25_000199 [Psilocybe cyanescens]|uniref:F-box domain-containing protein n=1 Tax=Psilocybe cyanescens TaxID=93625 RepID=A0A409XQM7_PSICY|nr:hypothetical protein CVT25_000199 [Psilocybe cyanescens]
MGVVPDSAATQLGSVEPHFTIGLKEIDDAYEECVRLDSGHSTISAPSSYSNLPLNLPELPDAVWQGIFELALPAENPSNQIYSELPSRNEVPMSLTQICHSWRKIAMGTSQLWTTINAELKRSTDKQFRVYPRVELIEKWLQLSALLPLSISIVVYHRQLPIKEDDVYTPLVTLLLRRLFLEFTRWKSAHLSLPDISFDRLQGYLKSVTAAPALETLVLTTKYDILEPSGNSTTDETLGALVARRYLPTQLWANSPRLRRFVIDHTIPDNRTDAVNLAKLHPTVPGWLTPTSLIPFHQLTLLQLDGHERETVTIPELLQILRLSPNLVTCRVLQIEISELPPDDSEDPIFYLLYLRDLRLDVCLADNDTIYVLGNKYTSLTRILTYFRAPALAHLALCYDEILDLNCLDSFLQNSSCSLRELELYCSPLRPGEFVTCLRLVPTLRSFRYGHINPEYELDSEWTRFQELAIWDDQKSQFKLCPLLEELTVDSSTLEPIEGSEVSDTAFADMIKRRLAHGGLPVVEPCFTTLTLTGHHTLEEDFPEYAALEQLCCPPFNLVLRSAKRYDSDSSYLNF